GLGQNARIVNLRLWKKPPIKDSSRKPPSNGQLHAGQGERLNVPGRYPAKRKGSQPLFLGIAMLMEEVEFGHYCRADPQRVTLMLVSFAKVVCEILFVSEVKKDV